MPRLEREPRSEDPHLPNLPSSEEVRIVSGAPEHSTREQPLVGQEFIGSQSPSDAEPSEEQLRVYEEAWRDASWQRLLEGPKDQSPGYSSSTESSFLKELKDFWGDLKRLFG